MSRKIIISDHRGELTFDLTDDVTLVGRGDDCELCLEDDRLSRKHLKLTLLDQELLVEDLGSSNGTELNGTMLAPGQKTILHAGDCMVIGDISFYVDRAPLKALSGDAPPSSRREAGDRKPQNNAVQIIAGLVVFLAAVFFAISQSSDDETTESARKKRPDVAVNKSNLDKKEAETKANKRPLTAAEKTKNDNIRAELEELNSLKFEIDQFLVQDAYVEALQALDRFETEKGRRRKGLRTKIETAIDLASERALGEYRKSLASGQAQVAKIRLKEVINTMPMGFEARRQLESMLAEDNVALSKNNSTPGLKGLVANQAPVKRKQPVVKALENKAEREQAKKRYFAEVVLADDQFSEKRYAEARTGFATALKFADQGGVDRDLRMVAERKWRICSNIVELQGALAKLIKANPGVFDSIPYMPGRSGAALSADETGVSFANGENPLFLKWRVMRLETIRGLISKAKLQGGLGLMAGVYLHMAGDAQRAEKQFHAVELQNKSLKRDLDQALADVRGMRLPSRGFVWHENAYITPGDLSRIRVREVVATSGPLLSSKDPEERKQAYAAFEKLGERAVSAYHRSLVDAKRLIIEKAKSTGGYQKLQALGEERKALDASRAHALELIFDTQKYPYPYRGRGPEITAMYIETSKEIKLRVGKVRELWASASKAKISPELRQFVARIAEYNARLEMLDLGPGPAEPTFILHLPKTSDTVGIQDFAIDEEDRDRIDVSNQWMKLNAEAPSKATAEERKQVAITNQYRLLMGRHAVRLHEKLLMAARGHSIDMAKQGFFAHENPHNPEKRTPRDRALRAGYYGIGISENIAMSRGGAQGAHNGWIGSSGHHRNILGRQWRLLGSGASGGRWTQNFSIRETGGETGTIEGGDGTPSDNGLNGEGANKQR